jgi:hypothetical protein
MKKLSVLILLILPAVLIFTAATLHYAGGPYWMHSDPEYLYLLNSLALTESKQTGTTGNPGTTLQIMGAATMKITHALDFSEKDSLEFAVLKKPEFYLTVINVVLVTFNTILLFTIGLAAFALTKNIWLSLLLQLSPFLSNTLIINGLPRVSPEPLLLFTGLLFALILIKMAFSKNLSKSAHWYMIILALVSGFGVATKLTFIPLLIIPLFVLPGLRNKIGFLFLTALSFVLWTWPIIPQYKILSIWYYKILTHTGQYGLGNAGIIDPGFYLQNIVNIFSQNTLFCLILFLSAGFIMAVGLSSAGKGNSARKIIWQDIFFRILTAATIAQLLAVMIVAKHYNDHYLLPAMSLSGFMLFLIFFYLKRCDRFSHFNIKIFAVFAGIIFVIAGFCRIADIKNVVTHNRQAREEVEVINQILDNEYKDYLKITSLPYPSPIGALIFGNYYINNGLYSESLQNIYGQVNFYSFFDGGFHTWTKDFLIEDVISKEHKNKIVLYIPLLSDGDRLTCGTGSVLYLKDVFGGQYQTIFVIKEITKGAGQFQKIPMMPYLW